MNITFLVRINTPTNMNSVSVSGKIETVYNANDKSLGSTRSSVGIENASITATIGSADGEANGPRTLTSVERNLSWQRAT